MGSINFATSLPSGHEHISVIISDFKFAHSVIQLIYSVVAFWSSCKIYDLHEKNKQGFKALRPVWFQGQIIALALASTTWHLESAPRKFHS